MWEFPHNPIKRRIRIPAIRICEHCGNSDFMGQTACLNTSGQFHKNTDSRNASTQAFGNPDLSFYVIGPELLQFFSWRIREYRFYGIGRLMREFFSWGIRRIRIPKKSFENPDSRMHELKNCGNPYFYGIGRWNEIVLFAFLISVISLLSDDISGNQKNKSNLVSSTLKIEDKRVHLFFQL